MTTAKKSVTSQKRNSAKRPVAKTTGTKKRATMTKKSAPARRISLISGGFEVKKIVIGLSAAAIVLVFGFTGYALFQHSSANASTSSVATMTDLGYAQIAGGISKTTDVRFYMCETNSNKVKMTVKLLKKSPAKQLYTYLGWMSTTTPMLVTSDSHLKKEAFGTFTSLAQGSTNSVTLSGLNSSAFIRMSVIDGSNGSVSYTSHGATVRSVRLC